MVENWKEPKPNRTRIRTVSLTLDTDKVDLLKEKYPAMNLSAFVRAKIEEELKKGA